jgi:hypothetical protein
MILITDDGRRFNVRADHVPTKKAWGGTFEIWGKMWNEKTQRWSTKNNLHYCNAFTIEPMPRGMLPDILEQHRQKLRQLEEVWSTQESVEENLQTLKETKN